ncbi:prephenate dehydrogenase [Methanocaldococcus villosus KIN24-T80]|uniref:Prephenate dehydrogenase n=1 Tax=Methanocaldococcus villosus KIN24-T80 TaxID=1069083 RepID=N6VU78_9EURY|nr:prephenate dehydrogenase [Methanocaldococcus villosus]ENN96751.1 prephenate dehydrogenase [Methanocaldococcus villosus KIN24-T80]
MIISIIGGTDGLGKWFARYLKGKGFDVIVTGRDVEKGKKVERELGVKFINDNIEAAKKADIVIIAVPINVTEKVIKEVAPHVRDGCLLMDITSIKEIPTKAMEEYANKNVVIIPTHPMFGPSAPSLFGQVIILTPLERHKNTEWFKKVYNFLKKEGAKIIITTPEKHDRIMAVVQGLTHFSFISLAYTLKELNVDIKESRKYSSPVYELMLSIIARIIGQNPYLYADIQMFNKRIGEIHKTFINCCLELSNVVKNKDREKFVKIMKEAAKHFGSEAKRGVYYSDKAIFALTNELNRLVDMIGEEVAIRNIDSNNVHFGILKGVDGDYLILDKNGKLEKFNVLRVEVFDGEKLKELKKRYLKRIYFDVSVLLKDNVDENTILDLLKSKFDIEIIDVYKGENIEKGWKSVTFRIFGYKKDELREKEKEFIKIIKNIGGKLRY